jgi:hypothetical protein
MGSLRAFAQSKRFQVLQIVIGFWAGVIVLIRIAPGWAGF